MTPPLDDPNPDVPAPSATDLTVVGIGASAGGLNAFKALLESLPAESGMAFLLVPHLDRHHESLMVELLARHTPMPVCEMQDGMAVEADRVYVIPPNRFLEVAGGRLHLTLPEQSPGRQTGIDQFLRSLAEACGEQAVGIILSGTGAHGSAGLRAVKEQGGLVMVQDPETAEYDQMPRSAIAAGVADYVLAPEAMGEALLRFARHARRQRGTGAAAEEAGLHALRHILALLRARTGYDFHCYRKKMLMRRVRRRMSLCLLDSVTDYLERLRVDGDEVDHLFRDLLIGVTAFFREPEAYRVVEQQVVAPLVARHDGAAPVRIWVAGCSTGEEAYSIAMLLLEASERLQRPCNAQIFATDIDEEALEYARQGVYPESIAADLTPERLKRFFNRADDHHYRVSKELREAVVFASQSLISDPPFSGLDLVTCRNLLIYLEPEVQRKIIALFHYALNDGGHLFLGASESVGQEAGLFEALSKKWRVFRRTGPSRRDLVHFPVASAHGRPGRVSSAPSRTVGPQRNLAELSQRLLLEEYAPAAVVINRRYEILYFFGPTGDYLQLPTGAPTADLLAMAREGMRTKLRVACHQAFAQGAPVQVGELAVRRGDVFVPVEARVRPLPAAGFGQELLLVTFRDRAVEALPAAGAEARATIDDASVVRQLELELTATREDLQSTIEELESSNEELRASNEEVMATNDELQSANEELQTSTEELQSLNEELRTVNDQLRSKVEELERSHNDITNLLSSTHISTVFLDAGMRIKLFTPSAAALFNLQPTDVGRRLSDFSWTFRDPELLADAEAVQRTLAPVEKAVETKDARHLLRRVQPYRTLDNRIDGVAVTFVDITSRVHAEEKLRESEAALRRLNQGLTEDVAVRTAELSQREALLRTLAANVPAMFAYVDENEVYRYVNSLYEERFDRPAEEIVDRSVREILGAEGYAQARPYIEGVLGGESQRFERSFAYPGGRRTMSVLYVPDKDAGGRTRGFFSLVEDITEHEALERMLRANEQRLRAIVNTAADGIITIDDHGLICDFNPAAERIFGRSGVTTVGQHVRVLVPANAQSLDDWAAARLRSVGWRQELTGVRGDGSRFPMDLTVAPLDPLGLRVAFVRDLSERKALEQEIIEASTAEQERIGGDIHDGLGQRLTAVTLLAGGVERKLKVAGRTKEAAVVGELIGHLQDTLAEARALARGLSPVEMDPEGLAQALFDLTEQVDHSTGVECRFLNMGEVTVYDKSTAVHLYRIAQEAIHNAVRHGAPHRIEVQLGQEENSLLLSVSDDGVGFDVDAATVEQLGLRIMRYRAGIIGGRLTVEPSPSGGTRVLCTIPLED